jgi:hypothetical protein
MAFSEPFQVSDGIAAGPGNHRSAKQGTVQALVPSVRMRSRVGVRSVMDLQALMDGPNIKQ